MVDDPGAPVPTTGLTMGEASALLGIPPPTLRSWERRYDLPTTQRTSGGHRRYSPSALDQLGLMRTEIATGRAPADAARRVKQLLGDDRQHAGRIGGLLDAVGRRDAGAVRGALEASGVELGLGRALDDVVLPTMRQVGSWWETGRCDISQERLLTTAVRAWLSRATTLAPAPPPDAPRVVLAVGPRDTHTLGIEALAALLAVGGTGSRVLGPCPPTTAVVAAAGEARTGALVVVSHLTTQRRPATASITGAAATGTPTFYAGNAFMSPASRRRLPATYLGDSLAAASEVIRERLRRGPREVSGPGRPPLPTAG